MVIAGLPDGPDSEIVLSRTLNARQAHDGAAAEYRRKRDIAPNVYVRTATAYRSGNEADATLFVSRLFSEMDAHENAHATTPSPARKNGS